MRPGSRTSSSILLLGLLVLAIIKAGLVGWYFMHLKFEGKWVYLLIVPAIILATILVLALVPDQAMKPVDTDAEETVRMRPGGRVSPGLDSSGRRALIGHADRRVAASPDDPRGRRSARPS